MESGQEEGVRRREFRGKEVELSIETSAPLKKQTKLPQYRFFGWFWQKTYKWQPKFHGQPLMERPLYSPFIEEFQTRTANSRMLLIIHLLTYQPIFISLGLLTHTKNIPWNTMWWNTTSCNMASWIIVSWNMMSGNMMSGTKTSWNMISYYVMTYDVI